MIEYWKRNILESWDVFSRNSYLLITPCVLLFLILYYLGINLKSEIISNTQLILILAVSLIAVGIHIGAISITYQSIINKKIAFTDIFQKFHILHIILIPQIAFFAFLFILLNIFPISGYVFVLIAIILYSLFLFFYDYLIVIENLSMKEAILRNYQLVSTYPQIVLQFMLVSFLIGFCLTILPLIGAVLSMCFVRIVGVKLFLMLNNHSK
ncbi:MAG: hypothetical protein CMG11_01265 [Candidatus Marinimicrobia bacterium]|nr:hypothetical protein [Candidatus Neomarinimicrobiota bacterium]|tara:strand:+ start:22129 stop:22761 length:633 start_codon:yes stop_codon:yes gene_type:complete